MILISVLAMMAWLFGEMVYVTEMMKIKVAQTGSGGIGAVAVVSYVPPYVGLAAFATGFYFMLRRLKRVPKP